MCCGIPRLEYIPTKVLKEHNRGGIYKSFLGGWGIVWKAILNILTKSQAPTISTIHTEISTSMEGAFGNQKWNHFVEKGGRIEYALDGLFDITENVYEKGDDGWEYEWYKDVIEKLPVTPLDAAFEIGKTKCFGNSTKVNKWCRGPHDHSTLHDDDMDDYERLNCSQTH